MKENVIRDDSNSNLKLSVFAAYFSEPRNGMELLNALESLSCADPSGIHYLTTEEGWFQASELAFTAGGRMLVISEEQPGWMSNMPVRKAIYYGRMMESILELKEICQKKESVSPARSFMYFAEDLMTVRRKRLFAYPILMNTWKLSRLWNWLLK